MKLEQSISDNKRVSDGKKVSNRKKVSKAGFLRWFQPLIQALRELDGSATPIEVRKKIIQNENLSDDEIKMTRGKNKVNKFENEVAFARNYLVKAGYIENSVRGIWTLTETGKTVEMTEQLASDIFKKVVSDKNSTRYPVYTKKQFLEEVFIEEQDYAHLVGIIRNKKNIILQGAPGVGKTFTAKRLAYSMMGVKDTSRVMMIQFHQSYSYEDFVMGFRPTSTGFELKKGVFYNFCKQAELDQEHDYFFIIDEINRGNLSQIFGELFMLIEKDKRGISLQLLYSDEKFAVPKNLYMIGMMNTADRSLALLDYALRRRFAFFEMKQGFETEGFRSYRMKLNNQKFHQLIDCVERLNDTIERDESLGEGFCIGHSYFCNFTSDTLDDRALFNIVEYELIPLLKEYWFDETMKVKEWSHMLRSAIR